MMIHSFILVIALSIDSFLASLAYGVEKIRIPFRSAIVVSSVGVLFLSISLFAASLLQPVLSPALCSTISFIIFFLIGISTIFQEAIKQFLRNCKRKKLTFEYSGISFVLDVYLDETKADMDHSKQLSAKEALYLAVALSIDSLVSGFALGIHIHNPITVLVISFIVGLVAVYLGAYFGEHYVRMVKWNFSWLSGILFLILAFTRIM